MPDAGADPFVALRSPITTMAPNPAFAAELRRRLVRALPADTAKEPTMSIQMTTRRRNGRGNGDVSYITLSLPDLARGQTFYGAVVGWRFRPGSSEHGVQVDGVIPMIGLSEPDTVGEGRQRAVPGFRVDDIAAAVGAVRAHGGTVSDPHDEAYGVAAEGHDVQGIPFYLHQLPAVSDSPGSAHESSTMNALETPKATCPT